MSEEQRTRELIARAAIDAIGPLLADLQQRLRDDDAKAERRIADLEAEVKSLRERVSLVATPPRDGRDGKDGRDCTPQLAELQQQLRDAEAKEARRVGDLEAEVKSLRERVSLGAIPPRDGRDGKDGRDGIDATFREPVDFEAGKTYPYGAIVRHRGGLWHAHRTTDAAPEKERSGWTLVVAGVHAINLQSTDEGRRFTVEIEPSAGAVMRHAFAVPVVIYRGVFNPESAYLKGDAVTHDGSLFIALADTRSMPAQSKEWQLAAKRGQNGKDGLHGMNAPQFHGFYDPRMHYPANVLVRTPSGLWLTTKATKEPPPDDARNGESKTWRCYLPLVTH